MLIKPKVTNSKLKIDKKVRKNLRFLLICSQGLIQFRGSAKNQLTFENRCSKNQINIKGSVILQETVKFGVIEA